MQTKDLTKEQQKDVVRKLKRDGLSRAEIAERTGLSVRQVRSRLEGAGKLEDHGYNLNRPEMTPQEAWDAHSDAFERKVSGILQKQWPVIKRPKGSYAIFHATDLHLDDDAVPLNLLKSDIQAAHDLGAIMVHGGDAVNNWPLQGRLAAQWARQQCTLEASLLRLQHYIQLLKPDIWVDGNHEEMNPYLDELIKRELPETTHRDYWTLCFRVETPGGRGLRAAVSHKFQKGRSWFHQLQGHIREMLEGEPLDLLMDGHLHSDGVLDHSLPERGNSALCVASAGYKVTDKYAARISRGGKHPKVRGRSHYIVVDDQAETDENFCTAFKSARQAEAMLNGLQNLRTI